MEGTPLWWCVQFFLGFFDFFMYYVVAHAVVRQRVKVRLPHILFAAVYTLVQAPVFYFLGGHIFRILSYVSAILIIRMVTRRHNIVDLAIIFAISSALTIVATLPVAALVWLANTQLMLLEPVAFLIAQSLTAASVLLMCKKFKLSQWFSAIQRNVLLKLSLLIIILIFLIIASILNFEYEVIYLLISAGAIIVAGLPLLSVLMKIYHNALGMVSIHDLKNSLISLAIVMKDADDAEVIKEEIRRISKDFGVDVSRIENVERERKEGLEREEKMTAQVNDFVDEKVRSKGKDVDLIREIAYHNDYEKVTMGLMLQWLGALMDNAIDAADTHPIYLFVESGKYFLDIRISNEYIGPKGQDIRTILEKGYSTKGEGRGIGLHNLNLQVTEKGGKINLDDYYEEGHDCNYLQVGILFESH